MASNVSKISGINNINKHHISKCGNNNVCINNGEIIMLVCVSAKIMKESNEMKVMCGIAVAGMANKYSSQPMA